MNINTTNDSQGDDYLILTMSIPVPKKAIPMFVSSMAKYLQSIIPVQDVQNAPPALLPAPSHMVMPEPKPRKGMASPKQKEFICNLARRLNMTDAEVCQTVGAKSIEQMSNEQANSFISEYKDAKPMF